MGRSFRLEPVSLRKPSFRYRSGQKSETHHEEKLDYNFEFGFDFGSVVNYRINKYWPSRASSILLQHLWVSQSLYFTIFCILLSHSLPLFRSRPLRPSRQEIGV